MEKPKSQSQSEKFVEAAKKAGAGDDEAAFAAKLKKIAKAKLKDTAKSKAGH
ncbi:MAG: hypothetical protein KGL11_10980 [Alphaproteobacteria bacterium]|nr:hypothetical protein [Alphaproteobacteria bacterium]